MNRHINILAVFIAFGAVHTAFSDISGDNSWKEQLQEHGQKLAQAHTDSIILRPLLKEGETERIERKGVLIWFEDAEATIVMCHGFLCNKYDISCFRNLFPWGRFNFLTFDFRGHGENAEGQCSTLGHDEVLDVLAAGNFLQHDSRTQGKPVFAWAFSMGAAAAIGAQAREPLFAGMILDCPYDRCDNVIKGALDKAKYNFFGYELRMPAFVEKYKYHPYVQSFLQAYLKLKIKWDTRHVQLRAKPFNPVELAEQITVPCFFIYCKNDDKIPTDAVRNIYEAVNGPKDIWETEGRCHFDSYFFNPEQYAHKVRTFIELVLHNELEDLQEPVVLEEKNIL